MKRLIAFWLVLFTVPVAAQDMDHAAHDMGAMNRRDDLHAGHVLPEDIPPAPVADPHAAHAGHGASPANDAAIAAGDGVGTDLAPGHAPAPPVSHDRPADRYFGAEAMTAAQAQMMGEHGGASYYRVLFDIAEYRLQKGRNGMHWESEAWLGGDIDRVVIKTRGEGRFHEGVDHAEAQLLFSHALDPYWNLRFGLRQDFAPVPRRTYAVIGAEGLAPYHIHLDTALFLSHKGDLLARLEAAHDMRLTQSLILQPRVEISFAAQNMPEIRIGSGLAETEIGLRLRYEIVREFAPYVGLGWTRKTGHTADYARADGERATARRAMLGVRAWF